MAKTFLKWKDRRSLLDNLKASSESLSQAGRKLLAAGNYAEAAEFFRKAKDEAGLKDLLTLAVNEGDFFLYSLVNQYLSLNPTISALTALAKNAEGLGLDVYAAKALAGLKKIQP
ncbi:MAG: hypothetical protein LBI10_09320 [Deltaproteobacteria bacterium]|nr:hypothetical protein [Deltaproteobacteria bacterium]